MKNPNFINQKKLTKQQVNELITKQGKLREDLFEEFCQRDFKGDVFEQDIVYEINDGNFLVIRDPKIKREGGKGDIWKADFMNRFVKWSIRIKEDYKNNRASSIDHWKFYTKFGKKLPLKVHGLIEDFKAEFLLTEKDVDFSYKSLDKISELIESVEIEKRFTKYYDPLIAYVGEVIKKRVKGEWKIDELFNNPYIGTENSNVVLNPINIVWKQICGIQKMDLRKETTNEIRNVSQIYKIVN